MFEKMIPVEPVPTITVSTWTPVLGRRCTLVRSRSRGSTQGAIGSAVAAGPPGPTGVPAELPPHAASSGTTKHTTSSLLTAVPPIENDAPDPGRGAPSHGDGHRTRA